MVKRKEKEEVEEEVEEEEEEMEEEKEERTRGEGAKLVYAVFQGRSVAMRSHEVM